jgi:hypothetical protein
MSQLMEEQQELEAFSGPSSNHTRVRELEAVVHRSEEASRALQEQLGQAAQAQAAMRAELQEKDEELMGLEGKVSVLQ